MESVLTRNLPSIVYAVTLLVAFLVGFFPLEYVNVVAGIAIAVMGIPHGALDLHLISGRSKRHVELVIYLLAILSVLIVWYVAPIVMLGVFLLNSAWHFGDCDLQQSSRWGSPLALLYGVAVLVVLIVPTDASVQWIIAAITGSTELPSWIANTTSVRWIAALIVLIIPLLQSADLRRSGVTRSVAVIIASLIMPSLLAFTWYFAVAHSWSSMQQLRVHLEPTGSWTWWRLIRSAAPLTLVTYAGIAIGSVYLSGSSILPLLFIGLSALTVPHSRLFHRVYTSHAGNA